MYKALSQQCIRLIVWTAIAVLFVASPGITVWWLVALAVLQLLKFAALVAGVRWIWKYGGESVPLLQIAELQLPADADEISRRRIVFNRMAATPISGSLFGVMDWRWLEFLDNCERSGSIWSTIGTVAQSIRNSLFRFESLTILVALLLVLRPYTPDERLNIDEYLSLANSLLLGCLIVAMGTEILVGQVVMSGNYSRYFHRRLAERRTSIADRRNLLAEVGHFCRLIACSLIAIAAICQSQYASSGGFTGIKTVVLNGNAASNLQSRWYLFLEFISFTTTTFATVGYGDVFPNCIFSRLIVSSIHLLTMGLILVLLQVVLAQRNEADEPNFTSTG